MLTGRPYKNKLQSLRVGLRTRQDRHTFTEDRHLKYSPPTLLVQPFLQSIYTHAQIYSQHEYHNCGILNVQYKAACKPLQAALY